MVLFYTLRRKKINPQSQSHFQCQIEISLVSMKILYYTVLGDTKESVVENYTDIFNSMGKVLGNSLGKEILL